jgi:hypothetical protein
MRIGCGRTIWAAGKLLCVHHTIVSAPYEFPNGTENYEFFVVEKKTGGRGNDIKMYKTFVYTCYACETDPVDYVSIPMHPISRV